ncbi:MAG: hypothetical protein R3D01_13070 [Hyphomicrobiales bacterium]
MSASRIFQPGVVRVAVAVEIVVALGLIIDGALGALELLPHADHDEGEQHRIGDADHGIFEAGDLVVGDDEVDAVTPADEELEATANTTDTPMTGSRAPRAAAH